MYDFVSKNILKKISEPRHYLTETFLPVSPSQRRHFGQI